MGSVANDTDKVEVLSRLAVMSLPEQFIPTHLADVLAERKRIGMYNRVEGCYSRAFVTAEASKVMEEPTKAAPLIRELLDEGVLQGPYPTTRNKQWMELLYLPHEKIVELRDRLDEQLGE
jgi:hypothetical protein